MPNPTTPPSSQHAAVSDTTPIRREVSGSTTYTTTDPKAAADRYAEMTFDTCDKFVGPMPVNMFLEEFIPDAPAPRPQTDFSFSKSSVSQNETEFIEAIRASGLCPNLHFANTTSRPGKNNNADKLKPDISVFPLSPNPDPTSHQPADVDWGTIALWIENKLKRNDPFIQIEELRRNADVVSCHVGWTHGAYRTCGQLIAYATALHRAQFRIFSFSVAMFEDTARLLRWDRSGVIYTEPFKWADGNLFEFLWRFNHLSAVNRGHDTTVSSAEDDEAEMALPKLRTYPKFENLKKENLHRILVWDDRDPSDKPRRYITPSAKWPTDALIGRATFGYIAFEVESGNLVYLKDFWRVDHPRIQKEGDVYRELHDAQVPNIAEMGRAGDVPLVLDDGISSGAQKTRTKEYVSGRDSRYSFCPGHPRVEQYVHYRLVLETVGVPLNRFKSTRQLCEVVRDAIAAHSAAYNKTRILHRDISAGNILITDKGTGILIDWDLSKKVSENADGQARQHSRTGTWQFISIGRLLDPWTRPHEVSDDLESFFWVLLYEVVRYRNDNKVMNLKEPMQDVFDYHSKPDRKGIVTGGNGKLSCVDGRQLSRLVIECLVETPCCAIIEEMRSLFSDSYRHIGVEDLSFARSRVEEMRKHDPIVNRAREKLRSSETFLSIFEKHLGSEWDVNDDGSLDLTDPRVDPAASRSRRKRKAEDVDDSEENIHVRRIGRMPPGSERKALDEISSQTSLSSSNHEMLFSTSSRVADSSGMSSRSLLSRNDGPPEKR